MELQIVSFFPPSVAAPPLRNHRTIKRLNDGRKGFCRAYKYIFLVIECRRLDRGAYAEDELSDDTDRQTGGAEPVHGNGRDGGAFVGNSMKMQRARREYEEDELSDESSN